jgi:hypothetical protein
LNPIETGIQLTKSKLNINKMKYSSEEDENYSDEFDSGDEAVSNTNECI